MANTASTTKSTTSTTSVTLTTDALASLIADAVVKANGGKTRKAAARKSAKKAPAKRKNLGSLTCECGAVTPRKTANQVRCPECREAKAAEWEAGREARVANRPTAEQKAVHSAANHDLAAALREIGVRPTGKVWEAAKADRDGGFAVNAEAMLEIAAEEGLLVAPAKVKAPEKAPKKAAATKPVAVRLRAGEKAKVAALVAVKFSEADAKEIVLSQR